MGFYDRFCDFVSIGSGGAGLSSALAVNAKGFEALVLEKREVIGGSTAMSGGVPWIRTTMVAEAVEESREGAMAYFEDVVGDVGPASSYERREVYINRGPEMVTFLQGLGLGVPALRGVLGLLLRCQGREGPRPVDRGHGF